LYYIQSIWAFDSELAIIDTILKKHVELYDIVKDDLLDLCKNTNIGRKNSPTVEQIVRAAIYKTIKNLTYLKSKFQMKKKYFPYMSSTQI